MAAVNTQPDEKFTAKPPLVAAAVKLRQDNGYTGAESIDDKDKKVHDRTGNTDGRKGGRPGKAPDDQGVDGMVELLEHIAGYEGQGQEHELGSDIA